MANFPQRTPYLHIWRHCMSGSTAVMWVWTRKRNAHLHAWTHLTAQCTHTNTLHADTSNCGSWLWLNANAVVSVWLKPKQLSSVCYNVNLWETHEYGGSLRPSVVINIRISFKSTSKNINDNMNATLGLSVGMLQEGHSNVRCIRNYRCVWH